MLNTSSTQAPQIHYLPSTLDPEWLTLHSRTDVRRHPAHANLEEIENRKFDDI